ncbi:MAG: 2-amino-4-hydroxy-6-hydroxymethyldihydropteridine diphosphokinase [Pseudomonadota bacterium]
MLVILIAIGANLSHPVHGPPLATCHAAVSTLDAHNISIIKCSKWYESAPVPASDQPWYVNGVVQVESALTPSKLMALLHEIEAAFGRERAEANAARVLDLDLLAYGDLVSEPGGWPILPHPRLAERAFVVLPLAEIAPDWCHPTLHRSARALAADLPDDQSIRALS